MATRSRLCPAETSQIALPDDGHSASITNFSQVRLATRPMFSDGATLETPVLGGSASAGYGITMDEGIAA